MKDNGNKRKKAKGGRFNGGYVGGLTEDGVAPA